jgi:hypothetical protein
MYMLGSALLFQIPLILIFINRIKPLKPSGLLKRERWVILLAFIVAGLMNPSPNVFAQLLIVVPLLISYQAGIAIIWYVNRKPKRVEVPTYQQIVEEAPQIMSQAVPAPAPVPAQPQLQMQTQTMRPIQRPVQRRYIMDIRPPARPSELA